MTVYTTVLSPPIPAYQNLPIEPQWYKPRRYIITAIQTGPTTIITTHFDNFYVVGQLIRLIIPSLFGCNGLSGQEAYVISLPSPNQVEIDLNSSNVNPFVSSTFRTKPQILAIGDIRSGAINQHGPKHTHPYIPGSFRNISPNPFHREFDFL